MKKAMLLLVVLFATSIAAWYVWRLLDSDPDLLARQVISIAPEEPNNLISFYPHISTQKRPQETYPFPIPLGDVGPATSLYSGPNQYPFYCMTVDSHLGQPEVDNHQGYGVKVFKNGELIGFSKDCGAKSRLTYLTINGDNSITKLSEDAAKQAQTPVFRVEQGTINRFIYTIIMPIFTTEVGERLAKSKWNNKLIYQFNGGSGIGFRQGRQALEKVVKRQVGQLLDGYAIIASSGNKTSYTYNMLLAEDTANRVKRHFVSLYGKPDYTVGVGGSGGGLAQYLFAQNGTDLLDGLIPLYSYPDMITQTTYALDCDLLNNYFTFRAKDRSRWKDFERRQQIEGLNAKNNFEQRAGFLQPVNQLKAGFVPSFPKGNSECINGYFGLSAYINNPRQGFIKPLFRDELVNQVNWSYWQDMKHVFGTDGDGNGLSTWDNQGVQYGLQALRDKEIDVEEFLHLNKHIGSWKPQNEMRQEEIVLPFGQKYPLWLSLWGNHNISETSQGVAKRHVASQQAMEMAYRSGQVFIGKVNLPILDARHYLEEDLDMHHMSASFYSRLRIIKANGHAQNQVIWVSHKDHDPTKLAFQAMDEWLTNLADQKGKKDVIAAKPDWLDDTCFNPDGSELAKGNGVFDATWNNKPDGACQKAFPMYSNSRIVAGSRWDGDMFKCPLMPINKAINTGIYGEVDMLPYQQRLEQIFPEGVCDYGGKDIGRPSDV